MDFPEVFQYALTVDCDLFHVAVIIRYQQRLVVVGDRHAAYDPVGQEAQLLDDFILGERVVVKVAVFVGEV